MNKYEYNELHYVEEPFLEQLERLGWQIIRAKRDDAPDKTLREDFRSVLIDSEFLTAIKVLNPWIEEDQAREVLRKVTNFAPGVDLLQANQDFLNQILEKVTVDRNRTTGQLNPNVTLIGFRS